MLNDVMDTFIFPKLMSVCITLVHYNKLVCSLETLTGSSQSQGQTKNSSRPTVSPGTTLPKHTQSSQDQKSQSQPQTKPTTRSTPTAVPASGASQSTPSGTPTTPSSSGKSGTTPGIQTKVEVATPGTQNITPKHSNNSGKATTSTSQSTKDTKPVNFTGSSQSSQGQKSQSQPQTKPTTRSTPTAVPASGGSQATPGSTPSAKKHNENKQPSKDEKTETSELDIKIKENGSNYTYDKNTKIATFQAKPGYGFNLVRQGNTEIWKADNVTEYSTKVVVGGIGSGKKNISVYLHSERVKNYNKPGKNKPWTERSQSIELNIKDAKTTYEYDYLKDPSTNLMSYTTKHGFQFNLVKQNRSDIWKATDKSEHSNKVELKELGNNKLDLTLFPTNNTRITFHKPGKNKSWTETTILKVNISTLVGNEGKTNINDSSQFNLKEVSDGFYKCIFKRGSRCTEFKHNNNSVWKHKDEEFGKNYVKEVIFNLNEVTVKIMDLILKFIYKNNQWILTSKTLFEPSTNKSFIIVTSEKDDGSKTSENNPLHYDVTTYLQDQFIFSFNDCCKFVELKYDNSSIWKHNIDTYGDVYPESIIHKPGVFLYIGFVSNHYAYVFDSTNDKWSLNSDLSHKKSLPLDVSEHPSYFTVVTEDDNEETKENDTSKYKVYSHSEGMYLYAIKDGVKCVEVKYNNSSIWKHSGPKRPEKFPKSISIDTHESVFEIEFKDTTFGFKLTEEGVIRYTVKNDKTQNIGLSLGFGNDSKSGGSMTSRRPIDTSSTLTLPTISSSSSSYKQPPPPPIVSQGSSSSYKQPPPPPLKPTTPSTPTATPSVTPATPSVVPESTAPTSGSSRSQPSSPSSRHTS